MWLTSGFLIEMLSDQARYGIWFSAIGIEVITNISLAKSATVTFTGSHLPERLGLFTLVILGESIMGLFMITDDLVDAPGKLGWDNLTLLIFSITIVKCQWFLYFDDYHEQAPAPTSIHSILWTYLHFVLNLSQLLLGVGCLDLIRIHQLTRASSHFGSDGQVGYPTEDAHHAIKRSAHAGGSDLVTASEFDESGTHDLVLVYVKKYFLFVAASVFFWNAAIKYVTSRPGVEHQQLNAFTLLGLEVGFCLLQVGHDLLVLYYAARKDYESQQYLSE
ncbi:hypothetical protein BGZ99_009143 [Dissophora globulifera]|uniref:Uncharacterized protein n=1 Tax=Dissophora globulifera TaxID=979702 RepID=A0A9P6RA84_9FUNG|nr:hypothetical protein BGZ99_009143 [Dissophora globulifera]